MRELGAVLGGLVSLLLAGCAPAILPCGSISIAISGDLTSARTVEPTLDMTVASYNITGSGPSDSSFRRSNVTGTSFTEENLIAGPWSITVVALNSAGTTIGSDQGEADVAAGQTTDLTLTVTPISGSGTLSISISWPADSLKAPTVSAGLKPLNGGANSLDFEIRRTGAKYTGSWPAGYYSLNLKLMDGAAVVVGTTEAVRILADQTTAAAYAYEPGAVDLTITPNLDNPITITLSGYTESLREGESMSVSASCSEPPDSYQWYLNGDPISGATTAAVTLGGDLAAGSYLLSVLVVKGNTISSQGVAFVVSR